MKPKSINSVWLEEKESEEEDEGGAYEEEAYRKRRGRRGQKPRGSESLMMFSIQIPEFHL